MDQMNDRRRFLGQTLGLSLLSSPVGLAMLNACKSVGGRTADNSGLLAEDFGQSYDPSLAAAKSVRMSATDPNNKKNIELYSKAVSAMRATDFPIQKDGVTITWWEAHAQIHNEHCPHGGWFFLPWHRAYLHNFEQVCRVFCGDDSFSLPYWDWSTDSRLPEQFDEGTPATNPLCDDTRSLKNRAALDERVISPENIALILAIADFETFAGLPSTHPRAKTDTDIRGGSGRLEGGPHNKVHATIQGEMGAFTSPRDPIFWLHHCNVDRLWEAWMAQFGENFDARLPAVANTKNPELNAKYWLNYEVDGFYSAKKVDGKFESSPAKMRVEDTVDAVKIGLSYIAPKKEVDASLPAVPPETKAEGSSNTDVKPPVESAKQVVEPAPINPAVVNLPVVLTAKEKAARRWRVAIRATITMRPVVKKSFGLAGPQPGITTIQGSRELDSTLRLASTKAWTSATLRLSVRNIPSPINPRSELRIFLNTDRSSASTSSPGFIGSLSFFGHNHDRSSITAVYDMLPAVKKLLASGNALLDSTAPKDLQFLAVWDRADEKGDLSSLQFTLDFLESA